MAGKKLAEEEKTIEKVNFQLEAPDAESVYLVGSFNNWDTTATPMKKDKWGFWKISIELSLGTYEYLFYVDGRWQNDRMRTELKKNPFGTTNNVLVVK